MNTLLQPSSAAQKTPVAFFRNQARRIVGYAALILFTSFQALADTPLGQPLGPDGLGDPDPTSIDIAEGTAIVAAGTGLALSQPGTIEITVPGGADVKQVLLYWEGHMRGDVTIDDTIEVDIDGELDINSFEVTGKLIGGPTHFFGKKRPEYKKGTAFSSVFRADITGLNLVDAGNNTLTVGGLEVIPLDKNAPAGSTRAINGAGVIVIYNDNVSLLSEIGIRDGLDMAFIKFGGYRGGTIAQTFNFDPEDNTDRVANLALFFSSVVGTISGQGLLRPESLSVIVNGSTTIFSNNLFSQDGQEWDTVNLPIVIPAGVSSLTIQAFSRDDNPDCASVDPDTLPLLIDPAGDAEDPENIQCGLPASFVWTAVGLSVPKNTAALGDRVWLDLDGDGIQNCEDTNGNDKLGDPGDNPPANGKPNECFGAGVNGVLVDLYTLDNPIESDCGDGLDSVYTGMSRTTAQGGFYLFDNLKPGNYCVVFNKPDDFECTDPNAGDDAADSDGVDAGDGTCRTGQIILAPGDLNRTVDLGLIEIIVPAELGDRVWEDQNNNGLQDCEDTNGNNIVGDAGDTSTNGTTECDAGIPDVPVELFAGNCTDSLGQTVTTDANGFYLFPDLLPGNYCVKFGAPPKGPGIAPFCLTNGFDLGDPVLTTQDANGDTVDSDADPLTGFSSPVSLAAGESNLSVDAGFVCPAKIGDRVWEDDGDGIQQCAENDGDGMIGGAGDTGDECDAGIEGIEVTLFDCGDNGQPGGGDDTEIGKRTTDADGFYMFGAEGEPDPFDLSPGTYYVQFDIDKDNLPAGFEDYILTAPKQGGNDTLDSDCMPPDGITQCVTVGPRGINLNRDCGLRLPEPECDLLLDKQCSVAPEPPASFEKCEGKLKQFTVVWNHPDPITITGSKNIATAPLGVVNFGDAVTFSGFSSNNVFVNFSSPDPDLNGQSVFHVSCSDSEFNNPDDCGKDAGDGKKTNPDYDNTWTLAGFVDDDGRVMDCNAGTNNGVFADNCTMPASPLPSCETIGKPTSLTLKYTGGGCLVSDNDQEKAKCQQDGVISGDITVRAAKDSKFEKDIYTVTPDYVLPGGTFELTFNGGRKFKSNTNVGITNGSVTELNKIHTSCSKPLAVGDVFGSLTVVAINGQSGGRDVTYKYTVINSGAPLSNIKVTDVPLGDIGTIPFLDTGSLATLETTVPITGSITNVGTAAATLNAEICSASDSVTVTVTPPPIPPAECKELKPIDALILEYDASQAGGLSIDSVSWYSKEVDQDHLNKNFINSTGPVNDGDVVTFDGFAAADADNNVDFLIQFSDGSTAISQFHRSCSDDEMDDVTDCGTLQGDGKDNDAGLNAWILRDLAGDGKMLGCP